MYLTRRARRREAARVERMIHAIRLSGRHLVDEELPRSWRTDTVAFPAIILAGTIL